MHYGFSINYQISFIQAYRLIFPGLHSKCVDILIQIYDNKKRMKLGVKVVLVVLVFFLCILSSLFLKKVFADWSMDFIPPVTTPPISLTPDCTISSTDPNFYQVICSTSSSVNIRLTCLDSGTSDPTCGSIEYKKNTITSPPDPFNPLTTTTVPGSLVGSVTLDAANPILSFRGIDHSGNMEVINNLTAYFSYNIDVYAYEDEHSNQCSDAIQKLYSRTSPTDSYLGINLNYGGTENDADSGPQTTGMIGWHQFPLIVYGNYDLKINPLTLASGYKLIHVKISPLPPVGQAIINGINFTLANNTRIELCLSNLQTWFRTDTGDIRMKGVNITVPSGAGYVSSDPNYPSIIFSSETTANITPSGASSQKGWVVDSEYSTFPPPPPPGPPRPFETAIGSTSYTSYISKVKRLGIATTPLSSVSGCSNPGSACDLSNAGVGIDTGIYTVPAPGLVITGYSHKPGSHVVILVNGNVLINYANANGEAIKVPSGVGNLFVLAASGNITVNCDINGDGICDLGDPDRSDSSNTQLDGIYSAEGDINLKGNGTANCLVNPAGDRRLNVGGALIANADYPFRGNTSIIFDTVPGIINNHRSLCQYNISYPSLTVLSRLDFVTQLTDFYKESDYRWEEVEP